MTNTLKLSTALIALTAFAGPAFAQEEPAPGRRPADQSQQDLGAADQGGDRHRPAHRGESAERAGRGQRFLRASLERIQAQDSTGLQGAVPNLNIVPGRGSTPRDQHYIRGVGQPDALQTSSRRSASMSTASIAAAPRPQFDLFDLQRIEVLRGPQGTLYGKNTIGGAINFVTRRPGNEFHASLIATYGSYNQMELRGTFRARSPTASPSASPLCTRSATAMSRIRCSAATITTRIPRRCAARSRSRLRPTSASI